jgi:uncharacterized protein
MTGRFLSARWSRLVMLTYDVAPEVLEPLVPAGTHLDLWRGRCFATMVGFRFQDTRLLGVAVPLHQNFLEVNLRFYVRREVGDETRRGVVFVKEIVPRRALAWVANLVYGENYVTLPMSCEDSGGRVEYAWVYRGQTCRLGASLSDEPAEGGQERFITEHYWGYAGQRDGSTLEYRVEHPVWRVWQGLEPRFDCDVAQLYGAEFAPYLTGKPASCFVADGSEVVVYRGLRLA